MKRFSIVSHTPKFAASLLLMNILVFGSTAHAASLKELLAASEQNNIDRRISHQQRERAVSEAVQGWTALLPTVTAQGIWTHNQYFATFDRPRTTTGANGMMVPVLDANGRPVVDTLVLLPAAQYDAIFRVDLPLIDVSRWFRAAAADAAQSAAIEREGAVRDAVRRQVIGSWFSYAAALAVRESATRSVGVAEAQAQLQEVRAKAGAATELERLRAAAEVQRNRQVVADATSLVAISRRTLHTLTGIDPGEEARLPIDDMHAVDALEELEGGIDQLPAVRASERDSLAAQRLANSGRALLVPTINAQFTERLSNNTGFAGQAASYNLGANITWRFDASVIAGLKATNAAVATAQLGVERSRLQARDQIHADWQRLRAALQKVEAAKAQLQAAQSAAQVARDRYAAGAATQIDVIQAERDLFGAEVGHIQARTELGSARMSLRISAGQSLEFGS